MIYRSENYSERIGELTERSKQSEPKLSDLDIGESAYVLGLWRAVYLFRAGAIEKSGLINTKRDLQNQLEVYFQLAECFENSVRIRNRYSAILTEANKNGCEICKRLVKIFDGRED